jgi:hypothetical protein
MIAAGLTDGSSAKMSGKWDHAPAEPVVERQFCTSKHLMKQTSKRDKVEAPWNSKKRT